MTGEGGGHIGVGWRLRLLGANGGGSSPLTHAGIMSACSLIGSTVLRFFLAWKLGNEPVRKEANMTKVTTQRFLLVGLAAAISVVADMTAGCGAGLLVA